MATADNMARIDLGACAFSRTVAATVASASYAESMLDLARTARGAGFGCLVVQAYDNFPELRDRDVLPLPLPKRQPLLPRSIWCTSNFTGATRPDGGRAGVGWYGWRRSHLYRTHMWAAVLASGFDLLAVDLDWRFSGPSPVPAIHEMRAEDGRPLDVLAWWDGDKEKMLNVGLMWIRASPAALSLARRVRNRTFAGWEQGIFNEELQFRDESSTALTCCHSRVLMWSWFNQSKKDHFLGKAGGLKRRLQLEGAPACAARGALPPAEAPPNASLFRWNAPDESWTARDYNTLRTRRWGRCTGRRDNTCGGAAAAWAAWDRVGGHRKAR